VLLCVARNVASRSNWFLIRHQTLALLERVFQILAYTAVRVDFVKRVSTVVKSLHLILFYRRPGSLVKLRGVVLGNWVSITGRGRIFLFVDMSTSASGTLEAFIQTFSLNSFSNGRRVT
jgi:hypothetical protein